MTVTTSVCCAPHLTAECIFFDCARRPRNVDFWRPENKPSASGAAGEAVTTTQQIKFKQLRRAKSFDCRIRQRGEIAQNVRRLNLSITGERMHTFDVQ